MYKINLPNEKKERAQWGQLEHFQARDLITSRKMCATSKFEHNLKEQQKL